MDSVDFVCNSTDSTSNRASVSRANGFDLEPPTILVVDDRSDNRMIAVDLLSMEGYEVLQAESGVAALEAVRQSLPDLILLDVMMPGMDGFEVCRQLKQDEQTRLIPVIFLTSLSDRQARISGIESGGNQFLSKPFDCLELLAWVKSFVRQKRLNEDSDQSRQIVSFLAEIVESRDPNTGGHCKRLVKLSDAFGAYLNLSRDQRRNLHWGSYLHDIGKVGIPDSVLLKTGELTPDEWEIMRKHVLIGADICKQYPPIQKVIPIVLHHHERWDGSGYPYQLAGDEIPYLAQVFQMIDIYDALTSERPYKRALAPEEALKVILAETQRGWRNPELVNQFFNFITSTPLVDLSRSRSREIVNYE